MMGKPKTQRLKESWHDPSQIREYKNTLQYNQISYSEYFNTLNSL